MEKSPISMMVRGTLERVLGAAQLDTWFARTAQKQYTHTVVFSTVYEARIAAHVAYDAWEADFFAMQDLCGQRYQHWLQAKGVPEPYSEAFPFCVETYLNFIYQYDAGNLRDVSPEAIEEFFMDYLLRKVMAKPPEYTHWPPALRLFYRFLSEKGYLDDPEPMMAGLHAIEPDFITLVKQRS